MSRFTSILLVSSLADGKTWVLMRAFGYDVGAEGSRDQITGPRSRGWIPRAQPGAAVLQNERNERVTFRREIGSFFYL